MTLKVGYILHRFPSGTDTFIRREIETLRLLGTPVEVVSVWYPGTKNVPANILEQWQETTFFILPHNWARIPVVLTKCLFSKPKRFVSTAIKAFRNRKPGLKGGIYQLIYLIEAFLVSEIVLKREYTHLHNHIGDQSGTVTMLAAHYTNNDFSITFHGWPVFFDIYNEKLKEKILASSFTRCISYFCRSQLMFFSGLVDSSSFKVIHCGLDLTAFPYRPPKPEVKTLFCTARLSPEKGLTVLFEVMAILIQRGHDLNLRLAGDGPSRNELFEYSQQLNIHESIEFLGYLSESAVVEELTASDIFVLPSFVEGLPVSAMEALAVGVPVVATNIAGTGELIEPGKTGLLVRPADANALVTAVETLIGSPELRKKFSLAGRQFVEEEFNVLRETAKLQSSFVSN